MDKALAQLCGQDHKQGPLAAEADCGPEGYGAVRSAVTSVTAQVLSDFETGSRSPWGVTYISYTRWEVMLHVGVIFISKPSRHHMVFMDVLR